MSDMSEYRMGMTGDPTSPLEETRRYRDALATSADAIGSDEVMTTEVPAIDITQLPTQIGVEAISVPSRLPPPVVEDWTADQTTWMLPVIPGTERAGNHAAGNGKTDSDTQGYLSLAL